MLEYNFDFDEGITISEPVTDNPTPKKKKSRKNQSMKFAVLLVIMCMFSSALFGFGGTYLANSLNGSNMNYTIDTAMDSSETNTILYQSVIQPLASTAGATDKMSIEEVAAGVKYSVVEITTETVSTSSRMGQFISTGAGSGVIISTDGYIVTNNHVISDAQTIKVRLHDGSSYDAKLIGTDVKTDLAVIKITAKDLIPAILGNSSTVLVGQTAIAIGNPLGELGGTVTAGIISALDREITIDGETMSLLQTDASINPGNSGGGLFNLYGELVGVVNAKSSGSDIEGLGFAIPIDTAKDVVEQIIKYGYVKGRIDTGFTLVDIQDSRTAMAYRLNQTGLYISKSVDSNFKSGDRITAVNDETISSLVEFNKQLNKYKVGDKINITIIRSGKSVTYPLTLTELKG